MPTPMPFNNTPKLARAKARLAARIAKEIAIAAGPAAPLDEAEFRFLCLNKPKVRTLFNAIVDRFRHSSGYVAGVPGNWAVYSLDDWAAKTALARRSLQRGLDELEAEGLIERERHRFGGTAVYVYIRPTVLGLTLAGKADLIPRLGKAISDPVGAVDGAVCGAISGAVCGAIDHTSDTSLTEDTKNTKTGDALSGLAPSPDQKDEKELQEGYKKEKGGPSTTTDPYARAWENADASVHPGKFVKLTPADVKKLKLFAKDCPSATSVLDCIVTYWIDFAEKTGAPKPPHYPDPGFALKFRNVAVNFWLEKNGLAIDAGSVVKKPASPQTGSKMKLHTPPTEPAPAQPPEDEKATLEEILELLK